MEGEEEIPEDLICPICVQLPDDQIFQCKNGHSICAKCCKSIKFCPQCRSPYTEGLIRNRAMESFIGSMKTFCSYRSQGCTLRIQRKDLSNHRKICKYNGKRVQLCKMIGYSCEFWTNAASIDEAIPHLMTDHDLPLHKGSKAAVNLRNVLSATLANLGGKMKEIIWKPILVECVYKDFGSRDGSNISSNKGSNSGFALVKYQFIFLSQQHTNDNTMSWIMVYLGDSLQEASKFEVEFEVKSCASKIPDLKWKVPCVGLLQEKICDSRLPVNFIQKNYVSNEVMGISNLSINFRIFKSGLDLGLVVEQTAVETIWISFTPRGFKGGRCCIICFAKYEDSILLFKCRTCVPAFYVCGECIEISRHQRSCSFEIVTEESEELKPLQLMEPVMLMEEANAS